MQRKEQQAQAQVDRLRAHLKAGNNINPLEAWRKLGIYRLSARVFDMREAGEDIKGEFVEVRNQFGEPCRVKSYRMEAQ